MDTSFYHYCITYVYYNVASNASYSFGPSDVFQSVCETQLHLAPYQCAARVGIPQWGGTGRFRGEDTQKTNWFHDTMQSRHAILLLRESYLYVRINNLGGRQGGYIVFVYNNTTCYSSIFVVNA